MKELKLKLKEQIDPCADITKLKRQLRPTTNMIMYHPLKLKELKELKLKEAEAHYEYDPISSIEAEGIEAEGIEAEGIEAEGVEAEGADRSMCWYHQAEREII